MLFHNKADLKSYVVLARAFDVVSAQQFCGHDIYAVNIVNMGPAREILLQFVSAWQFCSHVIFMVRRIESLIWFLQNSWTLFAPRISAAIIIT